MYVDELMEARIKRYAKELDKLLDYVEDELLTYYGCPIDENLLLQLKLFNIRIQKTLYDMGLNSFIKIDIKLENNDTLEFLVLPKNYIGEKILEFLENRRNL